MFLRIGVATDLLGATASQKADATRGLRLVARPNGQGAPFGSPPAAKFDQKPSILDTKPILGGSLGFTNAVFTGCAAGGDGSAFPPRMLGRETTRTGKSAQRARHPRRYGLPAKAEWIETITQVLAEVATSATWLLTS